MKEFPRPGWLGLPAEDQPVDTAWMEEFLTTLGSLPYVGQQLTLFDTP